MMANRTMKVTNKPHNAIQIMSETEGIGNNESIERITKPNESERQRIRAEFEEVKTSGSYGNRIHPLDDDGEPLCSEREEHNVSSWSNPKPIDSYPPGYREFCQYCVREWRVDQ